MNNCFSFSTSNKIKLYLANNEKINITHMIKYFNQLYAKNQCNTNYLSCVKHAFVYNKNSGMDTAA